MSELPSIVKENNLLATHKIRNGGLSEKPTGGGLLLDGPDKKIFDLSKIEELSEIELNDQMDIRIGSTAKISTFIKFLENMEEKSENTQKIVDYLKRIGGTGIRNLGSVVGNLLSAKKFTSDIYPLFLAMDQFHYEGIDENGEKES